MASALRLVLGDQLSRSLHSLRKLDRQHDVVLIVEVHDETTYVPHHKQKIVLVLAAMRHFAQSLRDDGITVDYIRLDDQGNTGSFTGEVKRAIARRNPDRLVVTEAGEWRVLQMMQQWQEDFDLPVEILPDDRFLCSLDRFRDWAKGRKSLRMEYFYREMRKETGWLMEDGEPAGGAWNYDQENRKSIPEGLTIPDRGRFEPDEITRDVMKLVEARCGDHFGDLDTFGWAVTRDDALTALKRFVSDILPNFGAYQDAMKRGEPFLFHSILSPYLNIGLLDPREVCEAAIEAWEENRAPLPAVEGFIRQILGWREFVRGIYWLHMPDYAEGNALHADRPLPEFYWTAETDMACLREAVTATRRHAYAHHIQRLMITGNFALLAGLDPKAVNEWYLIVYADAFEWVELPNTQGMALFADGGVFASKPYAASGAYIDRMSDYCADCAYSVSKKLGEGACPFNYLYWHFLIRNRDVLKGNPRLGMPYSTLDRMSDERRQQITEQAQRFLNQLGPER